MAETARKKIDLNLEKLIPVFLFVAIIAMSCAIRYDTFWLPHWKGDQSHYISLAVKLQSGGLDAYNLREIGLRFITKNNEKQLVFPTHTAKGQDGDILKALKVIGQGYYDEPLHMRAPLLPYTLRLSHALIAKKSQPFVVSLTNLEGKATELRPQYIFRAQLWAVVVPLFFHLANLFVVAALALYFFNKRVALFAAFIMTTNATGVMTSYRIWTEDMMTFFLSLAILLYVIFYNRRSMKGIFLAGCMGGLAILTKQTVGLVIPILWLYTFATEGKGQWNLREFHKKIFPKEMIVFVVGMTLVSGFWFLKVMETYGNPLHVPSTGMKIATQDDISGWFMVLADRYPPILFFTWGTMILMPIFFLVPKTFLLFRRQAIELWEKPNRKSGLTLLWTWLLVYLLLVIQPYDVLSNYNQEHRFLYPAYPALSILAAYVLDRIHGRLSRRFGKGIIFDGLILVILAVCAYWSVRIAMRLILLNQVLL